MSWQILIALSVVSNSVSILLQRVLVKESNSRPIAYSIFFQFLTGVFIGAYGWFTADMRLTVNFITLIPNLILMIFLYEVGSVCIFTSLKNTEASRFTIIFALRALFTTLGSALFLNEILKGSQLIGAILIFSGVILVTYKAGKFTIKRGELLALLAGLCFGLANTNDRFILKSFNLYPFLVIGFVVPALLTGLIFNKELKHIKLFLNKKLWYRIFLLCFIYGFSAITFFSALQISNNSAQVANINITSVVITVFLSIIFLGEKEGYLKKIIGAILSFLGVFLIK